MNKWWNRVFSRNLKNLLLNIFIYLMLIFICDIIEIIQFHTYSRYRQLIKYTLTNYFMRFSTMLYEAFPAETRLAVRRRAPVHECVSIDVRMCLCECFNNCLYPSLSACGRLHKCLSEPVYLSLFLYFQVCRWAFVRLWTHLITHIPSTFVYMFTFVLPLYS